MEYDKPYHYNVVKDKIWAAPGADTLTMDIYKPLTGKDNYPVLVVYHGGGWMINTKEVMDSLSMYIVRNSEFIVCNVNYRLLGHRNNTVKLNEIVEDAIGAFIWIKYNIEKYGGDPDNIAVTGDSAGAHLAMMVTLAQDRLGVDGFSNGSFNFNPTYVPENVSYNDIMSSESWVSAALLSYGVFDMVHKAKKGWENDLEDRGFFGSDRNINSDEEFYKAVSPAYLIPDKSASTLPPLLFTVGSKDKVTTPESIEDFLKILDEKDQSYEYWTHEGRPHAYLDGHMNDFSGIVTEFHKDATQAIDVMIAFMDRVMINGD